MLLSRQNFRQQIDPIILQRGEAYFRSDAVQDLEEVQDKQWSATVLGSEDYTVTITEQPDGTLLALCDCPYDWGPTCKHIAATLFKLDTTPLRSKSKSSKPRKTRADRIRDAIAPLSHADLVALLVDMALDNRSIAQQLLARYGAVANSKGEASRLAREAIQMGQRRGFIDYHASSEVARALQTLLARADTFLNQHQLDRALPIYQAVLEETVPAISHADDSSGSMGDCIEAAVAGIAFVAQEATGNLRQTLFAYLLQEATHKRYVDWDWGWSLAGIAADLVDSSKTRRQLDTTLANMLVVQRSEYEWSNLHRQQAADAIRLSVIERLDDEAAVRDFLEERQDSDRFFMPLVQFHLDRDQLATARSLVEQRITETASSRRGTPSGLLDMLLHIAQREHKTEEVADQLERLFTQTGNFTYYDQLKALPHDDWPQTVDRLATTLRRPWEVGEIYVREAMWAQLLTLVQAEPSQVHRYRAHLVSRFPLQLAAIYAELAEQTMTQKVNRKGYKEAIGYLQRLGELGQSTQMRATVAQWRNKYSNRRALIDELNKAFGFPQQETR